MKSAVLANRYVALGARWVLGLVFIAFSLGKIIDPATFADSIAAYRILPVAAVNVFALVMAWTEFLVGISLLNGVAYRSGALLAAALNFVFIVAVASAMARGLSIECGCFTVAKETVGWSLLIRDTVFLALAMVVLLNRDPAESAPAN
ncbi:MAG TPA: MauE/DoxX family redox-associated membrane protein [Armatimonadota bacterium]